MDNSPSPGAIIGPIAGVFFALMVMSIIAIIVGDTRRKSREADIEAQQRQQKEDADAKWTRLIQAIQTLPKNNESVQEQHKTTEETDPAAKGHELYNQERSLHELHDLDASVPARKVLVKPNRKHGLTSLEVSEVHVDSQGVSRSEIDSRPLFEASDISPHYEAHSRAILEAGHASLHGNNPSTITKSGQLPQEPNRIHSSHTAQRSSKLTQSESTELVEEADVVVQELGLIALRKRQLATLAAERYGVAPEVVAGRKGEEYQDLLQRETRIRARLGEIMKAKGGVTG